ncbi:MAG: ATP-binding protein [Bacteroidales bacterium]|nr:ATP-binding protein [Bacteroidales bacterium]
MKENPFLISGYISPDYFCDRENETKMVTEAIRNRRHLTIFSPRRIGKTGLIRHVFYTARQKKYFLPVYTDILATSSLKEFTECFGRSVLSAIATSESGLKKILKKLASLRPKISIDPVTGEPSVSITVNNKKEAVDSLEIIFRYIQEHRKHFAIAIDEFQQVAAYPEKNVEAVLRTHIQQTSNVSLIFSGSRKHILTGIFSTPDKPFYNSTQMMEIGKITRESYKSFIIEKFKNNSFETESSAVDLILEITSVHTFYVQYLCNRLFSLNVKVDNEVVNKMLFRIITENEAVYASYITLLTPLHFRLLRAIAINGGIQNPTSSEFLSTYDLGAASSVALAIKSLTEKEFITSIDGSYSLNDQFFNSWLKYKGGSF